MTQSRDRLPQKGNQILRQLAVSQGAAYRSYGNALARFGAGEIDTAELFKTAGDVYFKEAGEAASAAFEAGIELYSWALSLAGMRVLGRESEAPRQNTTTASEEVGQNH